MKKYSLLFLVFTLLMVAVLTNPSEEEYLEMTGEPFYEKWPEGLEVEVERVNFFLFSAYTPVVAGEHGITHLGVYGGFFQISNGQFDYPSWLEILN
ncbi:hypothetical protein [Sutcliffiella horikoshii]|uniref:hypothetical protein n=1 Tax=Sutcliffiella horikoshii TaxID=79883 RepID=UPI001CFDA084|nr:hypothetical protein [Sutcliffiella horikoshii]